MIKIFENKKNNSIRTISLFGLIIYSAEDTAEYRIQHILGNFISAKRLKSDIQERKIFKIFNIPVSERVLENDICSYYIAGKLFKRTHYADLFFYKYLKNLNFSYDDVYIFNSNSGEIFLFLAYLSKSFINRNNSKNPLFVATKKYHVDMLKLYYPDAKYIFIPNCLIKTKNNFWKCRGHKFFILFSGNHFQNVEKNIKNSNIDSVVHYFKSTLTTLKMTENDCSMQEIKISSDIIESVNNKINEAGLNSDNFIILSPEALTCTEISKEFWKNLVDEIKKRNIDIYLNITDKKHFTDGCKTLDLNFSELYYLAKKAKAVISLRSGLSEFLLQTGILNVTIYTKFRNRTINAFSTEKTIAGFSMLKIPFVNKKNIIELNYDAFNNENELLNRVLSEFDKFHEKEYSI